MQCYCQRLKFFNLQMSVFRRNRRWYDWSRPIYRKVLTGN